MVTVSNVNSSPSTNSSTLTSGTCRSARQRVTQLVRIVDAISVCRARTGNRLEDQWKADAFGRLPALRDAVGSHMARRANSGGIEHLLHALLVTKRNRLLNIEPRNAERFPQLRSQHHARLPQAFDAIERPAAQPIAQFVCNGGFIPQGAHVQVTGERFAHEIGQRTRRLVAHTQHCRADFGEAASELRHVGRIARRNEQDDHDVAPMLWPATLRPQLCPFAAV